MIFALIGAVVILASPWIFLYFSPATEHPRALARWNAGALVMATIACGGLSLWIRSQMLDSADFAWWPLVALAYSALVFPLFLLFAGLIRNFLLFPD